MTDSAHDRVVDDARRYGRDGLFVFPIWPIRHGRCACGTPDCPSAGKHPIGALVPNGLKGATCDETTIRGWWQGTWADANLGIALGPSRLFAIDIDGPDGFKALAALEQRYDALPPTATSITARGCHLVFRAPDAHGLGSRKLGPQLETKGDGGYIVAPPSRHLSGATYAWELDESAASPRRFAEPPTWLVEVLRRREEPAPSPPIEPATGRLIHDKSNYGRAAVVYECEAVRSTPEGQRNNRLHQAACRAGELIAGGVLDENEARTQLEEAAASVGLTRLETSATITSGIRTGRANPRQAPAPKNGRQVSRVQQANGAGGLIGREVDVDCRAVGDPQATAELTGEHAPRFRLLTTDELENRPPVTWLVDDILPAGELSTVYGPSGGGKTFLVIDWCQRIALAGDRVVYVLAEGGSGMGMRTRAWRERHGTASLGDRLLWIDEPVNFNDAGDVAHFIAAVQTVDEAPKLIVIDTLARCLAGNENSAEDMGEFIRGVDQARRPFGAGALVVHHTGHDTRRERGSSALKGASFLMAKIESGPDQTFTVSCAKMKDGHPFEPVRYRIVTVGASAVIEQISGLEAIGAQEVAILDLLSGTFGCDPPTTTRLQRACGLTSSSFYRSWRNLQASGLVSAERAGRGARWHITEKGLDRLRSHNSQITPLTAADRSRQAPRSSDRELGVVPYQDSTS